MKNNIKILAILMAAVCMFGCNKLEDNPIGGPENEGIKEQKEASKVPMTFSVGTVKTTLQPGGAIYFNHDDEISIFDGTDNNEFLNTATKDNLESVTFRGEANEVSRYYALYPYQVGASLNGNTINNVNLPACQTATKNSFDPAANISVDISENTQLELKNVCSLFKIVVNAGEEYNKAVITNNDGTPICGTLNISFDEDGYPVANVSNGSATITLEGTMDSDKEQTAYYAVILPKTYSQGFTVKLYKEGQEGAVAMKVTSTSVPIGRAQIANIGHIETGLLLPGVFSVSATEKVQFARGNLWCNETTSPITYGFENDQYTAAYGSTTAHRTHYFKKHYSNNSKVIFESADSPDNPCKGWRTLSNDEWSYLLGFSKTSRGGYKYAKCMVNGLGGVLIFPDSCSDDENWPLDINRKPNRINTLNGSYWDSNPKYTIEEFSQLESAGFVFLPVNGRMNNDFPDNSYGSQFNNNNKKENFDTGSSHYISSNISSQSQHVATCLFFTYAAFQIDDSNSNYGYSIRLVCPCTGN